MLKIIKGIYIKNELFLKIKIKKRLNSQEDYFISFN